MTRRGAKRRCLDNSMVLRTLILWRGALAGHAKVIDYGWRADSRHRWFALTTRVIAWMNNTRVARAALS